MLALVLLPLLLAPSLTANSERNVQRFVKIDVSRINVKNTTESSNVSSTTTTPTLTTIEETTTTATSTTGSSNITSTQSSSTVRATTESTTTSVPPATTTTASVEPPKPIDIDPAFPPLKQGRAAKLVPRGYFCQCDLEINTCDINCCCDIDCNEGILKAFDCDEEQLYKDQYHHDAGLQSCRVQGGLFCLIEPIHEEGDESHYDPQKLPEATRHKWQDVFPLDSAGPEDFRRDHYRVGNIVHLYNETSEAAQSFALPYSLTDGACQIGQPVRFLRASINHCRRTVDELAAFNRAFVNQHQSARFFRLPKKSNVMEHYCVEEQDCINVTLSVCYSPADVGDAWNCTQGFNTTSNATTDVFVDFLDDGGDEASCGQLEINFHHNYTHLLAVRMNLFCRPRSSSDTWGDALVWQRVAVNFPVATGKRTNATRSVSGNLGYLIGKPLIVSHMEVPPNGTVGSEPDAVAPVESPPKPMLAYFTNGTRLPDECFRLRLPLSRVNRCTLTEDSYQTINFGVDSWHRCNVVPLGTVTNISSIGTYQNFTEFCRVLQDGLYAHLLHGVRRTTAGPAATTEGYESLNLHLSRYANPVNRTADWIPVRSVNVIPDALPGSDSVMHDGGSDYFTCNNMLINVDYRFYYARERVHDVRHQAILHAGEVVFGPRVNLRFRRDEDVRVPIFVQVQFFDLTSSSAVVGGVSSKTVLLTKLSIVCVFLMVVSVLENVTWKYLGI